MNVINKAAATVVCAGLLAAATTGVAQAGVAQPHAGDWCTTIVENAPFRTQPGAGDARSLAIYTNLLMTGNNQWVGDMYWEHANLNGDGLLGWVRSVDIDCS